MRSHPSNSSSTRRIWLARGIAVLVDVVQVAGFPVFSSGSLLPFEPVLDVVVAVVMIMLVGWHIAFLPSFIIELLPIADLAPTWTLAVFIATRGRRPVEPQSEIPLTQQIQSLPAANESNPRSWSDGLAKPVWAPSPLMARLIWCMLCPLIVVSSGIVVVWAIVGTVSWLVALPFLIGFLALVSFPIIFHRLRDLPMAMAVLMLAIVTLLWAMMAIWPDAPLMAILQLPYLAWLCIVASVQIGITHMNRQHAR